MSSIYQPDCLIADRTRFVWLMAVGIQRTVRVTARTNHLVLMIIAGSDQIVYSRRRFDCQGDLDGRAAQATARATWMDAPHKQLPGRPRGSRGPYTLKWE